MTHSKGEVNKKSSGWIRIIGGKWRGRKLPVITHDGLRPTTDRTRETVFNWLMHDIQDANCLDMYAGSGALGLEALSRNASTVAFVEKSAPVAKQLKSNVDILDAQAQIINDDAISSIATLSKQFSIVFIDPPFHKGLVEPSLHALIQHNCLENGCLLYIEQESEQAIIDFSKFQMSQLKLKRTGQTQYMLLQYHQS